MNAMGNQHPIQARKKAITTTIEGASCQNEANLLVNGSNKFIKINEKNTTD
jgi:hypothetical protein